MRSSAPFDVVVGAPSAPVAIFYNRRAIWRYAQALNANVRRMTTKRALAESLEVDSLVIQMITEKTPDPYGQPGFAALEAVVRTTDPTILQRAEELRTSRAVISVSCAGLRVKGTLSDIRPSEVSAEVALHLDVHEINYRKPTGPRITWTRA